MKLLIALANSTYDVRGKAGTFSAATEDAVDAAHKASADAHEAGTKEAHEKAARLHRIAAKRHADDGDQDNCQMHEGIANGHDSLACTSCPPPEQQGAGANCLEQGLANGRFSVALNNDSPIDDGGWGLIAPFGEHPKTRLYRENGLAKEQKYVQVLDNEAADAMLAKENSFFRSLKRAIVGIPVYKGHGDLNDADPKAISNEKQKIKLGVVDQIRKGARGIEAHFALDNDGAEAVAAGWKFPSAFWWVLPIANDGDVIRAKPFKLISVALTQFPNISGVESLANARPTEPAARTNNNEDKADIMKQLLIGWLAAQGIALANEATDQAVFEAFIREMSTRVASVTALGNEKHTLNNVTVPNLTRERDDYKTKLDAANTALANEQNVRKSDRKAAAVVVVDQAIGMGIITVADRDARIAALENSADFTKDAAALFKTSPTIKTRDNNLGVSGRQQAALDNEAQQRQSEYDAAFKVELAATGQNPVAAHHNIMTLPKYAGLAAKFVPAKS